MIMKKLKSLVVIFLSLILLSSCSKGYGKGAGYSGNISSFKANETTEKTNVEAELENSENNYKLNLPLKYSYYKTAGSFATNCSVGIRFDETVVGTIIVNFNNSETINYDASYFEVPNDYFDTLITMDISVYDKKNNKIDSIIIDKFFYMNTMNSSNIPDDVENLFLSKLIDKAIFEDICTHTSLKKLMVNIEGLNDISAIGNLTKLETLYMDVCSEISDISSLGGLTQLENLSLTSCYNILDMSAIGNLINLKTLSLSYCNSLKDANVLSSLVNLESLSLTSCENLSDITALGNLKKLVSLSLSGWSKIYDISALSNLSRLESLTLNCDITDLSPLGKLAKLEYLDLLGCTEISDINPISNLKNIKDLTLGYFTYPDETSEIVNISAIGELTELENLAIFGCKKLTDISPLNNLEKVKKLELNQCDNLVDVNVLGSLLQIETLSITNCEKINDISSFINLKKLANLSFYNCNDISDISVLNELTQLEYLTISNCENINDLSVLSDLTETIIKFD